MIIADAPSVQVNGLPRAVQKLDPLESCVCTFLGRVILDLVDHDVAFVCLGGGG
jgi:hypothetical protein